MSITTFQDLICSSVFQKIGWTCHQSRRMTRSNQGMEIITRSFEGTLNDLLLYRGTQEAWDLVGLTLITATCFVNSAWFPPAETKSKEKLNKVNSTTSQTYCVALVRSLLYSVSSGRDRSNMRRTMRCASAVATSRCTSTTALSRRGRSTSRMLRTGCSRTPAEGNISIDVTKLFFLFERAENEDFWCINCINPWGGLREHVKNFL